MGAIELQVFVSLVVILGAAFVALICDFLKGNNEQLRESNIEMRVRQSEREKREEKLDQVQRHTIETLVQARVAPLVNLRAAVQPPAPVQAQPPVRQPVFEPSGPGESFERSQQERSARRREGRRQHPVPHPAPAAHPGNAGVSPSVQTGAAQVASWAESIVLKSHPQAASQAAVADIQPPATQSLPPTPPALSATAQADPLPPPAQPAGAQAEPSPLAPQHAADPNSELASWAQRVVRRRNPEPQSPSLEPDATPAPPAAATEAPLLPLLVTAQPELTAAEPAAAALQPPPPAGLEPVSVSPARLPIPFTRPAAAAILAQPAAQRVPPLPLNSAAFEPALRRSDALQLLALSPAADAAAHPSPVENQPIAPIGSSIPDARLSIEPAVFDIVTHVTLEVAPEHLAAPLEEVTLEAAPEHLAAPLEEETPSAEAGAPVVRIRVLSDDDLLPLEALPELAPAVANTESLAALPAAEPRHPAASINPLLASEPQPQAVPVSRLSTSAPLAEPDLAPPVAHSQPSHSNLPLEAAQPNSSFASAPPEPLALAALDPRLPSTPRHPELRSNVVEMIPPALMRANPPAHESEPELQADLVIPGGFHEAPALASLLDEEAPFNGLAIVISVVDYVRLMADQGKPAAQQLMGSISRLVMSLAREQDFASRIAEDEFVLLFARETGAAAKRRIQLVSERLWDFQLRSLGTVSVIFSWGASESTTEPVVHAVEHAREQMLESRRNRRVLASGVGRFRRRAATS